MRSPWVRATLFIRLYKFFYTKFFDEWGLNSDRWIDSEGTGHSLLLSHSLSLELGRSVISHSIHVAAIKVLVLIFLFLILKEIQRRSEST